MAIFRSLTFDGINSLDYGIYITGEAVYNAPERNVEMVTIPGKNGALALDQGRFENIEVTYHAGCFADSQADFADKVMRFRNALASRYTYKRLTDEYHPDEYRLGLYKSGLDVDAVRYGTAGEFNIVFDCKPQRFLIDGDRAISPTEWSDVQTESGELVTIDSDGSLAVRSLEVSLSPIQDLHGYDSPWVGGAGKNKLDTSTMSTATTSGVTFSRASDGTITVGGKATAIVYREIGSIQTESGVQYTITGTPSGGASGKYRMTVLGYGYDYGNGYTFTGDGNSHKISIDVYKGYPQSGTLIFKPMVRLASETDATYAPYENICPISGRTEVVTQRTGVNLIDESTNESGAIDANGNLTVNANFNRTQLISVSSTIEIRANFNTGYIVRVHGYNSSGQWVQQLQAIVTTGSLQTETIDIPSQITYVRLSYPTNVGTIALADIATYTTALGRTVYGGTLDVVSGELVVDRAMVTYDGSSDEDWHQYGEQGYWCTLNAMAKRNTYVSHLFCDKLPTFQSNYGSDFKGASYAITGWDNLSATGQNYICMKCGDATVSDPGVCMAWLAENPLTVVYELASPQTIQLSSQEVQLLLGTNHLWSDAGEITVTYGVHPYYNPSPFDSKPLIKVTGTGTLGIGEYILTITGSATQTLYIDCETMEIYTIEGTVPTGASSLVSINKNDFPVLKPGINNISVGSGITAVTITPRWWRI